MTQTPALQLKLSDVVEEYNIKLCDAEKTILAYEMACANIKSASTISGTYGGRIETASIHKSCVERSLLKSAWQFVYNGLNISQITSASDRKRFQQAVESELPPFTLDNLRTTFGDYLLNPRLHILRGLAEVFCSLDPFYKSHDKVKIGVKGLPKKVILSNVDSYGWGRERLRDILNALAAYQGRPFVDWSEIADLLEDGDCLKEKRDIQLRRFRNGNGHLIFGNGALEDINRALAEFYGEVLADTVHSKPSVKTASTSVSKDLQYYPTPKKVATEVIYQMSGLKGAKVLEPSCGCGRLMDILREKGAIVAGIEFDVSRAQQCRDKGHNVLTANFLETVPTGNYDRVVMNPPFYGKHYAKHLEHALKFLKPDGILTAILPVTARYDHQLITGEWRDLPVGSFTESGTNINTTILTKRRESF